MGLKKDVGEFAMKMIGPWMFISVSVSHFPQAFYSIIASGQYWKLFVPSAFLDVSFGKFWATVAPSIREDFGERVVPVLEGRVKDGKIVEEPVYEPVSGVVMEVGAGNGNWSDVFASFIDGKASGGDDTGPAGNLRKRKTGAGGITKIYGVEPNEISAAALKKRVAELGMSDVYEVVPVGIEKVTDPTAWDGEIPEGSLDCIVCICCLCSIPDQEKNIKYLYKLLKPGGRWYFHEHVRATRGGILLRLYQCTCHFTSSQATVTTNFSVSLCRLLPRHGYGWLSALPPYLQEHPCRRPLLRDQCGPARGRNCLRGGPLGHGYAEKITFGCRFLAIEQWR